VDTIRKYIKEDGSVSYHAEVRLKGAPAERGSFRTKTLAKEWIQRQESAIRDGRHFRTTEAKKHTVKELIECFISQWLNRFPEKSCLKVAAIYYC